MSRLFCSLFLIIFSFNSKAQHISNVDFNQIKSAISDSSSHLYYPTLISRLLERDTTLLPEEYHHLYYGNIFQKNYHPYGATEKQKFFMEAYNKGDTHERTEKLGFDVLHENPVNLDVLLKMIFLYNKHKDIVNATLYAELYVSFLEVIYASGTGKDCENAFVVISVDDEYRITSDLGLKVIKQALIGSCDRLAFSKKGQKRKNRIKSLYFNVKMPLTYLSKAYIQSDIPVPDSNPDEDE